MRLLQPVVQVLLWQKLAFSPGFAQKLHGSDPVRMDLVSAAAFSRLAARPGVYLGKAPCRDDSYCPRC